MQSKRFTVVSPQEIQGREAVGSYAESYGWAVEDAEAFSADFRRPYYGDEREMRRTARDLNRRVRQEAGR
jgi:hypothetical protein